MLKSCIAEYDSEKALVRIGNNKIEKHIRLNGSFIRTESVRDKISCKEWRGGRPLWQRRGGYDHPPDHGDPRSTFFRY